ncbi:MAG: SIS domain-containing protein [Firmicutes bacterium]|nr:SIS domain-containing protein [Bacillota bacterium]
MDSQTYYSRISVMLKNTNDSQLQVIKKVAQCKANAIKEDKILHYFGCGHSLMLCEEVFYRAGGLACMNPIFDPGLMVQHGGVKSSHMEKQENYAPFVLDQYNLQAGDIFTVFSTSGRNPVPVDAALYAREKGLTVIAVTSMAYSTRVSSRHSSGKNLHQVADIVIDSGVDYGDALLDYGAFRAIPGSTIVGAFIINAILAETLSLLTKQGFEPPVLISGNIDGGSEKNEKTLAKYRQMIKHL